MGQVNVKRELTRLRRRLSEVAKEVDKLSREVGEVVSKARKELDLDTLMKLCEVNEKLLKVVNELNDLDGKCYHLRYDVVLKPIRDLLQIFDEIRGYVSKHEEQLMKIRKNIEEVVTHTVTEIDALDELIHSEIRRVDEIREEILRVVEMPTLHKLAVACRMVREALRLSR